MCKSLVQELSGPAAGQDQRAHSSGDADAGVSSDAGAAGESISWPPLVWMAFLVCILLCFMHPDDETTQHCSHPRYNPDETHESRPPGHI